MGKRLGEKRRDVDRERLVPKESKVQRMRARRVNVMEIRRRILESSCVALQAAAEHDIARHAVADAVGPVEAVLRTRVFSGMRQEA